MAERGARGTEDPDTQGLDFDFDKELDRTGVNSVKWDEAAAGELPMWVADTDFRTAPCVERALARRVERGGFGYSYPDDRYRQAVSRWWARRHGMELDPDQVIFATGVVPALSSAVRSLTNVAEKVIVTPPVYNIFYNSIVNNGRRPLECPLAYDPGRRAYRMDFDALERAMSDPLATLMILCNPHNPTGNLWSAQDLARLGEMSERHGVLVVSDEIHCDVVAPGRRHVPFASASPACARVGLTLCSPSKAFNLAGMQSAYAFASDPLVRARFERGLNTDECAEPNVLACVSTIAAYEEGEPWLDRMNAYVRGNFDLLDERLAESGCGLALVPSPSTYLAWVDCSAVAREGTDQLVAAIRRATGLIVTAGSAYGSTGERFLRMNLGTARSRVADGARRLVEGVAAFA